jgi:hypothetical protein
VPVSEDTPDDCVLCQKAVKLQRAGNIVQVKCQVNARHRSSFYMDERAAIMAWNLNQRHKRNQGSKHG